MKFALFSNDSRIKPFLFRCIEVDFKPEVLICNTGLNPIALLFHIYTKGLFLNKQYLLEYPTAFYALKNNIELINFSKNTNQNAIEERLRKYKLDLGVTFLFGILKPNIIGLFSNGIINMHPGYLPFNRGASPSNWVIKEGKKNSGYTIHYISEKIDKGAIVYQKKVHLSSEMTTEVLNLLLISLGTKAMIKVLFSLKNNIKMPEPFYPKELGSYEKPFTKQLNQIRPGLTEKEIEGLILSSTGKDYSAFIKLENKEILIKDFIKLDSPNRKSDLITYTSVEGTTYILIPLKIK